MYILNILFSMVLSCLLMQETQSVFAGTSQKPPQSLSQNLSQKHAMEKPSARSSVAPQVSPTPRSSVTPRPSVTPRSSGTPKVFGEPLNADPKVLLKEFLKAQSTEIKAIEHRNKSEIKELKQRQKVFQKEWERNEKEARHRFFETHQNGPERRTYIQDYIKRREALVKLHNDERITQVREHENELTRLRKEQTANQKKFKENLDQGIKPATDLWPKAGT